MNDTEWRQRAAYTFWPRVTVLEVEGDRTARLRRDDGEELEAVMTMPAPGPLIDGVPISTLRSLRMVHYCELSVPSNVAATGVLQVRREVSVEIAGTRHSQMRIEVEVMTRARPHRSDVLGNVAILRSTPY